MKSDAKVTGKKIHYMKSTKRNERTCRTIAISVGAALVLLGVLFYVFFASKVVMIVMWLWALLYYPALLMIKRTYDKSFYIPLPHNIVAVPELQIEGILFTMDNCRYNNAKRNKQAIKTTYGNDIKIFEQTIPRT